MFQPRARAAGFHRALALATIVAAAIALPGVLVLPGNAHADTFIVGSTADDGSANTLRSRIDDANGADPENLIRFNVASGSEIQLILDVEEGRPLPVAVTSDITLDAVGTRVSVTSGPLGIFSVDGRLTLEEVSLTASGPGPSVDLLETDSELEIVTNIGDREWGDEVMAVTITGNGRLIKSGDKTLTLFGDHDYEGGTDVLAGILMGDTSALQGDFFIDTGAELIFDEDTANTRVRGTISGDGLLRKRGEELMEFTSETAITADIVLEKGTMSVTAVPAGDVEIQSNTTFQLDIDTTAGTFAQVLTGSGKLAKRGNATVDLTPDASSSWTGATEIQGGRLKVTSTDTLKGSVAFTGNGELEFEVATPQPQDFTRNITDTDSSGTVVKTGTGELKLSGSNSFSALMVEAGDVRGTTGSISGDVDLATSTELIFEQGGASGSHSGDITGAGGVTIDGPGTVTLSGKSDYTGGTDVDSQATLRGTSASLQGRIDLMAADSKLVFSQASNGDFTGAIVGPGSVEKTGPGDLTVTGANSYTGLTSVNGGGLFLDGGSITGQGVVVASGARIGGEGTIATNMVIDGTLKMVDAKLDQSDPPMPVAVGSLSVSNNVAFNDGSRYEIDIDYPDLAVPIPLLDVTGNVAINGTSTLVAKLGPGTYDTQVQRTLISASNVTGSFAQEDDDFAFLTLNVDYSSGSDVILTVDQDNSQAIADVPGLNLNEQEVGRALDNADILNAGDQLAAAFRPLTNSQVPGAVDQLSGLPLSSSFTARIAESERFGRTLMRRMRIFADGASFERDWTNAAAPTIGSGSLIGAALLGGPSPHGGSYGPSGKSGYGGWLDGYGAFGSVDESLNAPGFDYSIGGIATGIDYQLEAPFLVGGAFGYARTGLKDFSGLIAKGTGNTYRTSLYGSYGHRLGYVAAHADYAYSDFDSQRGIAISGLAESASGSAGGNEFTGAFELGSRPFERWQIRAHPFISLEYTHLGRDAFQEVGTDPSLDLDVLLQSYNSLSTAVGTTLDHTTQIDKGMRVRAELRLRYNHEFLDHQPVLRATFRDQFFEVQGVSVGRDTGLVGVGIEFIDRYNLSTFIGYDLRVNSQLLEHNVNLGVLFFF